MRIPAALRKVSVPSPKSAGISQFHNPMVTNMASVINAAGTRTNKNLNLCFIVFVLLIKNDLSAIVPKYLIVRCCFIVRKTKKDRNYFNSI